MYIEMLTGRGTIDAFYGKGGYLETVQGHSDQSAMRNLIASLRSSSTPLHGYGMTHMHELGLRAADDMKAPELISIRASDEYNYFIKYLMPQASAPWPYAWVQGHATSVEEATSMVLTAMDMSGGWAEGADAANDAS